MHFSGDIGTALVLGGVGLSIVIGAIFAIVGLVRVLAKSKNTGAQVAAALGIAVLALFIVAGLFATGCAAIVGVS